MTQRKVSFASQLHQPAYNSLVVRLRDRTSEASQSTSTTSQGCDPVKTATAEPELVTPAFETLTQQPVADAEAFSVSVASTDGELEAAASVAPEAAEGAVTAGGINDALSEHEKQWLLEELGKGRRSWFS
jgi:hypothetical protein